MFIVYEWQLTKNKKIDKEIKDLTWKQSIAIGIGQALATLPGVSRAGAVMLTMMAMGQKRSQAAKYSFLLALPTICAAAGYDMLKLVGKTTLSSEEILLTIVGFVTAFVVAFFVLKWFIAYLQKHTLTGFGIYRLVITTVLLLAFGSALF
jgi:undecaprenyl-diphosphatase